MENPFLRTYGGWGGSSLDFIPLLSQIHLPRCQHPTGRGSRSPGSGNATPSSGHGGDGWGQGKEHPRGGWDGKRSGKGRIWEESSTAWVVSGKGKAPDPLYKYSQANTRREQNISTSRKNSGENKGSRVEQVIPGYRPQPLHLGHSSPVPAPAEGTVCKKRGALRFPPQSALTSLGMWVLSCSWNYRESAGPGGKGWKNDGEKPSGEHPGGWRSKWGILCSPLGPDWGWLQTLALGRCWMWAERGKMGSFPGSDNSKSAEGAPVDQR